MDFIHSFTSPLSLSPLLFAGREIKLDRTLESAFGCPGTNFVVFFIDCIKACEQRAKSFETLIRRMLRTRGDCSALLWGSRAFSGLGAYQLSMLGHKRRHRRRRHGIIIGRDKDTMKGARQSLECAHLELRDTLTDI